MNKEQIKKVIEQKEYELNNSYSQIEKYQKEMMFWKKEGNKELADKKARLRASYVDDVYKLKKEIEFWKEQLTTKKGK